MKKVTFMVRLIVLGICCWATSQLPAEEVQRKSPGGTEFAQTRRSRPGEEAIKFLESQTPSTAESEEMQITIYHIEAVSFPAPTPHPYRGEKLPTTPEENMPVAAVGMGGMAMAPGGMGAEPNPYFGPPAPPNAEEIVHIITSIVAPQSWEQAGGKGRCAFDTRTSSLVVLQTREIHRQIAPLLERLSSGGGPARTMVVEACWLLLDSTQLERLHPPANPESGKIRYSVDPKILEELARSVPGFRGQITCFSSQTVHIVAGDRRSVVIGEIPVVGGDAAAYQPVMANPNIGALLQVCPTLVGANSAILDIQSTVTGWREGSEPLQTGKNTGGGSPTTFVDRVQMPTQQIACSLRAPLGKAVIVGGLTLDPNPTKLESVETKAAEKKQLYLIVRVSVCEDQ